MNARTVTLVLPYDLQEQSAHDQAIAAAWALTTAAGAAAMDVLQLVPTAGAVAPRASDPRVHWWELASPHAAQTSADVVGELVVQALQGEHLRASGPRLVLIPASAEAEQTAALIAATLQGTSLGRCSTVALDGGAVIANRLAFGSRLGVGLRSEAALCCATWRPEADAARLQPLPTDCVRRLAVDATPATRPAVEVLASTDRQARLDGARVVVSGGRGIGSPEGFGLLARVAERVGGALGGSLPAVDAGWVPVSRQVGVSGRFVSPRVYLAVGISGTPQHLAGIAPTSRIVAVNNDPDAPIFSVADVGVVADWRELLPLVVRELEAT